jgi:ADP-ribose pyrophosphatase
MTGHGMRPWRTLDVIPLGAFTVKRVEAPSGYRADYVVLRCPDVVAVLALTGDGEVVLVNQYRQAVNARVREIPGGMLADGEAVERCAARELAEETGYHAEHVQRTLSFRAGGANTEQTVHLCVARDVRKGESPAHEDPVEEAATVEVLPFAEVVSLVRGNRIQDAASVIAVLLHLTGQRGVDERENRLRPDGVPAADRDVHPT